MSTVREENAMTVYYEPELKVSERDYGKLLMARKLLKNGYPIDELSDAAELPVCTIKKCIEPVEIFIPAELYKEAHLDSKESEKERRKQMAKGGEVRHEEWWENWRNNWIAGFFEARVEVTHNMLTMDFAMDDILEISGLPLAEVEKLRQW